VKIGVVFPQGEMQADPRIVTRFAGEIAQLGADHLLFFEHVLGVDPRVSHPNARLIGPTGSMPYDIKSEFYEPMVLFGFLAAITDLELATSVLVAPQRQTALLAKQAATVDILSGGRLRLGIGVGWNSVEYDALGRDFSTRGRIIEEQIPLLRLLWTTQSVTFEGKFHTMNGVGIAPPPLQRPIPIWVGGSAEQALDRAGRLADGWFSQTEVPGEGLKWAVGVMTAAAERSGRHPPAVEGRIRVVGRGAAQIQREFDGWRSSGATHVALSTVKQELVGMDAHLRALEAAFASIRGLY
jgi:probable F420-dependent oxidoreductase